MIRVDESDPVGGKGKRSQACELDSADFVVSRARNSRYELFWEFYTMRQLWWRDFIICTTRLFSLVLFILFFSMFFFLCFFVCLFSWESCFFFRTPLIGIREIWSWSRILCKNRIHLLHFATIYGYNRTCFHRVYIYYRYDWNRQQTVSEMISIHYK